MKLAQMSGAILQLLFTKLFQFSNILGMFWINRFLEDTLKHLNQAEVKNLLLKAVCFVPHLLGQMTLDSLTICPDKLGNFSIDDSKLFRPWGKSMMVPPLCLFSFLSPHSAVFFPTNSPWVLSVHRIFCTVEQWNIQTTNLRVLFLKDVFSYPRLINNKTFRDPTWPV